MSCCIKPTIILSGGFRSTKGGPRKPRGGISRSGCRKIAHIIVLAPIRREPICRGEAGEQ